MSKPMIRIHDLETNEIIDREMTDAEFKAYETDKAEQLTKQAELDAKAAQRQSLLDKLGITADEAKLLFG
jgi:hypothetical protein